MLLPSYLFQVMSQASKQAWDNISLIFLKAEISQNRVLNIEYRRYFFEKKIGPILIQLQNLKHTCFKITTKLLLQNLDQTSASTVVNTFLSNSISIYKYLVDIFMCQADTSQVSTRGRSDWVSDWLTDWQGKAMIESGKNGNYSAQVVFTAPIISYPVPSSS